MTAFTRDEQYTMMTLWAMFRSPLMLGCSLPDMDPFTLSLVTNDEVIAINQHSKLNRELFDREGIIAWYAISENERDHYVAIFNTTDSDLRDYCFALEEIGTIGDVTVIDLWSGERLRLDDGYKLKFKINAHGTKLLKISI